MSKGKRDESRSSKTQNIRRRMTKTSREESQMDDEGKKRKETRSSTEPNTRRRIATKTSPRKSHERTVAVTAQESSDGMREKTMRIESNSPARCSSLGGAEHDKTEKTNELTIQKEERRYRRLWQQVKTLERDEFEASNTTLEHEICRHCEESSVSVESIHQQ